MRKKVIKIDLTKATRQERILIVSTIMELKKVLKDGGMNLIAKKKVLSEI